MSVIWVCRVNIDLEIKVADFGLSRAMSEGKDYYRMGHGGQLPVRWMAPECLIDFLFTEKSDVVSRVILMWKFLSNLITIADTKLKHIADTDN